MKKIFATFMLGLSVAAFAQTPPACNSEETRATFVKIMRSQIVPGERYKSTPLNIYMGTVLLENARPLSYDKTIKRYECAATLVIDASRGLDSFGKAIVTSPQALASAGTSVAQLERLISSDFRKDGRQIYSFPLTYSSQLVGNQHVMEIDNFIPLRAMLVGSFITAHTETTK